MKNCEYCGKGHNGEYGSGRFCSQQCARGFSTKAKRKEINKQVSKTLKKKNFGIKISESNKRRYANGWKPKSWESEERKRKAAQAAGKSSHNKWLKRKVKIGSKHNGKRVSLLLNITNEELEQYRIQHPVCEICGREERIRTNPKNPRVPKLAIDHDHKTGKFRGLLCNRCNYMLGWAEGEIEGILSYLNKPLGR